MQDDNLTLKNGAPAPHHQPRPAAEAGRYKAVDVATEAFSGPLPRIRPRHKTIEEIVAELDSARISQDDLERIAVRGGPGVGDVKAFFRRLGEVAEEDRIQNHLGFGLREIRISLDSVATYPFPSKAKLPDSERPVQLRLQVLRCGSPIFRVFLLSNAPLQVLGCLEASLGLEQGIMDCITGQRSITLPCEPGEMRYLYLASPAIDGLLSAMHKKCMEAAQPDEKPDARRAAHYSEPDLPAPSRKQAGQFHPFSGSKAQPQGQGAREWPVNTLGISYADLDGAKKVGGNLEELREIFSNPQRRFVFRGWEVVLTRPGVEGTRLLVSPRHPSDLVDGNAAAINYIVPSEYAERRTAKGHTLYYIRVKQEKTIRHTDSEGRARVFSLEKLEDSCQILEVPPEEKPAASAPKAVALPARPAAPPPEKAAPIPSAQPQTPFAGEPRPEPVSAQPSAGQILEEAFGLIRKYAANLGGGEADIEEHIFGNNIAIMISGGSRAYLVTDAGDWHKAREAMEEHLSSGRGKVMLTEIQTSYARKRIPLPSGGDVVITVKPVGRSIVHGGASDTLEMIPPAFVEAAIASADRSLAGEAGQAPGRGGASAAQSPEEERRRRQTIGLIRSAVVYLAGGATDDMMMDIFMDPDTVQGVQPGPDRWYLILRAESGIEYALFRFPCQPGSLRGSITSMPAAAVFTSPRSPGYSFMLIEKKFLTPSLIEAILSDWKEPAAGS